MSGLKKLSDLLYKIGCVITVIFMVFLTLLIVASVIARFIFNSPVQWQYESTLVCLSWNIFIGMSMTFKMNEHMRLTFVVNALKPSVRVIWLNVIDVILIAFMIYTGILSISVIQTTWATLYKTIPVSKGLFYLPYPIGAAMSAVQILYNMLLRNKDNVLTKEEQDKLAEAGAKPAVEVK